MTAEKTAESTVAHKPAHEIRLGRIKATIWANRSDAGLWYSVVLKRIYKADSQWKETDSFSRDDLPLVEKVAAKAFDWIAAAPANESAKD